MQNLGSRTTQIASIAASRADNGMVTTTPSAPHRWRRSSRGATMVEFAIVATWLFTLIFGILEGGFAVRARNAVNNATDDAARRGAVAGTSADADYQIIRQLIARDAGAADIQYVVVYRAATAGATVPDGCRDGNPQPNLCNVYRPDANGDFDLNAASYGCPAGLGTQWCPNNRISGSDITFLGVYVRADYEPIINQLFFDFDFTVDANATQVIETSGELQCAPSCDG